MTPRGMQGQYAGFISRAAAFILDIIFAIVIIVVLSLAISLPLEAFLGIDIANCPPITQWQNLLNPATLTCFGAKWLRLAVTFLAAPVYYILFWTLSGQTPAQYLLGLRVVRVDGKRMAFLRAVVRYIGYFVSLATLGLGFVWVLIDDQRQGFHDKMARTVVVYSWEARQNERLLDRFRRRFRRLSPNSMEAVRHVEDLRSGQLRADLIMCSFTSESGMSRASSHIQAGIREGQIEMLVSVEMVKDELGRTGLIGVSDLAEGTSRLPDALVATIEQRVRQLDTEALFAQVPDSTFILLLVVEEAKSAQALKFLSGKKIGAQLYDLERFTQPPGALPATASLAPAPSESSPVAVDSVEAPATQPR